MIRIATENNIKNIVDLLNRELSYGLMDEDIIYKRIINPLYINLIYEYKGKIASFLSGKHIPDIYNEIYTKDLEEIEIKFLEKHNATNILKVLHLVTEPEFRNNGFAGQLIRYVKLMDIRIFGNIWCKGKHHVMPSFMHSDKEELVENFFYGYCPICEGECKCLAKFILS